jgi:DNA processing protein
LGSAKKVFETSRAKLLKIPDIGESTVKEIFAFKDFNEIEKEVENCLKNNIDIITYLDSDFPFLLKHCYDSPIYLFKKGNVNFENRKIISVVGTRNATEYGKLITEKIIEEIKDYNPLIVSGLAYGIDITAHRAALNHGLETVGVVGHGLKILYPAQHKSTAQKMQENGCLLSEFFYEVGPNRENFPERNRIIAGMSEATIVIEAAESGGALITAKLANNYNRDVFAVPGNINQTYSAGCNQLIKSNIAALIDSGKDIVNILGWEKKSEISNRQTQMFVELEPDEQIIVDIFEKLKIPLIDQISIEANFPMSKCSSILFNLEMKGVVKSLPGKRYQRT